MFRVPNQCSSTRVKTALQPVSCCILFNAPHRTYKPRPPTGRLFVERHAHQEFVERMVEEVAKMKIGDPLDRSVTHGPQNHK